MGTGAFAISAGNVDGAIVAMGESEMLIEFYTVLQPLLIIIFN